MASTFLSLCSLMLLAVVTIADDLTFIDDVYSFNDIYLAWTVSPDLDEPQIFQYRECGKETFITIPINDASEKYKKDYSSNVYSVTLNNLTPDTIYEIKISPQMNNIYRVRTLSLNDDWKFYVEEIAPYAVGAVGAVILAPVALDALGFGSVGIAAESVAAGIQSGIGSVEAGSVFAMLQSLGMTGISTETSVGLALGGAGIIGGISDVVEDECGNPNYIEYLDEKFKEGQYFLVDQMDKMSKVDMDSLKATIDDYINNVNVDIDSLWNLAKSNYNEAEKAISSGYNDAKKHVSSGYHDVKNKIFNIHI